MWMFKRKQTKSIGWEDITLSQFEQIDAITKDKEGAKELRINRVIYGEERGSLAFLNTQPPKIDWKKKYWINGREYRLQADMTKLNVSQFIDYQSGKSMRDWLSVVLIPIKAKYNDGSYDIQEIKKEVGDIKLVDAIAISTFLKRQSQTCVLIMKDYLEEQVRKAMETEGLSETQKKNLQRQFMGFSNSLSQLATLSD